MNAVDLYQIYRVILSSFFGIPQKQMTVLLDSSDKDPLQMIVRKTILLIKGGWQNPIFQTQSLT